MVNPPVFQRCWFRSCYCGSVLLSVQLVPSAAIADDVPVIRRAEHLNALLVHVLDAQFPANERNGNLDGLGVGHVLILAARALCIAAHPYLANGFRIRFCAIELVGISISIHRTAAYPFTS